MSHTNKTPLRKYSTDNLPGNAPAGTSAFDTTLKQHVYFTDGRWLKMKDDTLVADRVVEVYILSGQSNAGGTASADNLSGYTQKDGSGDLAETREHILFTNNHSGDQPGVGGVLNPGGSHGAEVSFLDGIDYVRTKKQFLIKYYSGGSSIGTWDKTQSKATVPENERNNWDKLITSIDNAITWATNSGYTLEWKGFVWWQGESDRAPSNASAKIEYKQKLQTLIANVRSYVDKAYLPVCLIEVDNRLADDAQGLNSVSTSGMSEIQDAQSEVADEDDYVEFIDTAAYSHLMDWSGPNSGGKFDGVHWQTEAYVKIGWDTAERMNDIIEGTLDYSPPAPILWIDPSDATTVTYDPGSNKISQIQDKSGNDYHAGMSTVSYQPIYNVTPINGLATIQANSNVALFSLVPSPGDWQDIYIVAQLTDHTSNSNFYEFIGLFEGIGSSDAANIGIQGYRGTQDFNNGWVDNWHLDGSSTTRTSILPSLLEPFLLAASSDSSIGARGYCIGVDRYGFTVDRVTHNEVMYRCIKQHQDTNSGASSTYRLPAETEPGVGTNWSAYWVIETDTTYIGYDTFNTPDPWTSNYHYKSVRTTSIPYPSRGWKGPIGEILVFDRKLSSEARPGKPGSEREEVEGYLAHKWNLQDKLPAAHPYKSTAP